MSLAITDLNNAYELKPKHNMDNRMFHLIKTRLDSDRSLLVLTKPVYFLNKAVRAAFE